MQEEDKPAGPAVCPRFVVVPNGDFGPRAAQISPVRLDTETGDTWVLDASNSRWVALSRQQVQLAPNVPDRYPRFMIVPSHNFGAWAAKLSPILLDTQEGHTWVLNPSNTGWVSLGSNAQEGSQR